MTYLMIYWEWKTIIDYFLIRLIGAFLTFGNNDDQKNEKISQNLRNCDIFAEKNSKQLDM